MTDEHIISYLLEELPEADLERFEDECFAQQEWPDQIKLVEEDLIESYLCNELSPERQQRFEQNYLTTKARQERVVMAAALLRYVDEHNAASESATAKSLPNRSRDKRFRDFWNGMSWERRIAAAVVAVAFIAGAVWLFIPRAQLPRTFASLTLTISNSDRAEGPQADHIKLSRDIDALKISLTLPQQLPQSPHYRVELMNNKGEAKSIEIVGQDTQSVQVVVAANELSQGQYTLKLFAIKTDGTEQRINGSYYFNVE